MMLCVQLLGIPFLVIQVAEDNRQLPIQEIVPSCRLAEAISDAERVEDARIHFFVHPTQDMAQPSFTVPNLNSVFNCFKGCMGKSA